MILFMSSLSFVVLSILLFMVLTFVTAVIFGCMTTTALVFTLVYTLYMSWKFQECLWKGVYFLHKPEPNREEGVKEGIEKIFSNCMADTMTMFELLVDIS